MDRKAWAMSPLEVNAFYDPMGNEINMTAAILQAPLFEMQADDAANYGGIGATIGHEISHGFDNMGAQFDGDGVMRAWWTEADRKAFEAIGAQLVAQFNALEALPGKHVNGELTLPENIADLLGLQVAFKTYQASLGGKPAPVIAGNSGEQRFFLSFAQSWRVKRRDSGLQAQLFISAWAFVYISAAAAQRAREGELQNLRLQTSLKAAQLCSLTNQLKPHFLFNALNNIRFMIHEDGDRADAMIVALSELLRYSLENSQQGKTRLSQELAIIEAFISIMHTQLEERLDFQLSVAPVLMGCLLPPMVLQLLVENAIKHGLDHLPRGGRLSVQAVDGGDSLRLIVSNDAPPNAASVPPGSGPGLPNIERRLHLLYGERAALNIKARAGHFQVELSLPKEFS